MLPQLATYVYTYLAGELPSEAARAALRIWLGDHAPLLDQMDLVAARAWVRVNRDSFPALDGQTPVDADRCASASCYRACSATPLLAVLREGLLQGI